MGRFEKFLPKKKDQKNEKNIPQEKVHIGIDSVPPATPKEGPEPIKIGGVSKVLTERPAEVPAKKEEETGNKEDKEKELKKLQKELEDINKEIARIEEELKEAEIEEEQARNRAAGFDNDPDYKRAMDRVTNLNGELEQRQKEKEKIEKLIEELRPQSK